MVIDAMVLFEIFADCALNNGSFNFNLRVQMEVYKIGKECS
jgi:hypothetical protein